MSVKTNIRPKNTATILKYNEKNNGVQLSTYSSSATQNNAGGWLTNRGFLVAYKSTLYMFGTSSSDRNVWRFFYNPQTNLYDTYTSDWYTSFYSLSKCQYSHANGIIYTLGGKSIKYGQTYNYTYLYNLDTRTITNGVNMPTNTYGSTSCYIPNTNGEPRIYYIPEYTGNIRYTNTTISTHTTVSLRLPQNTGEYVLISYEDKIYIIGGYLNPTQVDDCYVYDTTNNTITKLRSMPMMLARYGATLIGASIYIFCGISGNNRSAAILRYNIPTNTWYTFNYKYPYSDTIGLTDIVATPEAFPVVTDTGKVELRVVTTSGSTNGSNFISNMYIWDIEGEVAVKSVDMTGSGHVETGGVVYELPQMGLKPVDGKIEVKDDVEDLRVKANRL